jgi:hypothetical protein
MMPNTFRSWNQILTARRSGWLWVFFAVLALGTVGLFLAPAYVMRPFHYQSPLALSIAMNLKEWTPVGTMIGALLCAALAFAVWPIAGRWGRVGLGAGMFLVAACATMSRLNYFEWMFHPVPMPGFVSADNAKLDAGEMVLALNFNNDARAYPVSQMAYHHIVNDFVGGVPVAVTY